MADGLSEMTVVFGADASELDAAAKRAQENIRGFGALRRNQIAQSVGLSLNGANPSFVGERLSAARRAIHAFLFGRGRIAMVLALAIVVAFAATARSQTPPEYDTLDTAEGWAWSQIKQGLPADFGDHCGLTLDPRAEEDTWWRDDPCRTIPASFLIDILTRSPRRGEVTNRGVEIKNAKIVGDVDLAFAKTAGVPADFLVADAVPRNRSPTAKFPANREKNREFSKIWPPSRIFVSNSADKSIACEKIP